MPDRDRLPADDVAPMSDPNGYCAKVYCECMDGCYCDVPCGCRGPNGETE